MGVKVVAPNERLCGIGVGLARSCLAEQGLSYPSGWRRADSHVKSAIAVPPTKKHPRTESRSSER